MRRNLKRYYGAGDLRFITCSCYRRQPLLVSARRRNLLLTVLEQMRKRYQFVMAGYVVMPEHIHLLISEPQKKNPSTVMHALKLSFARRVWRWRDAVATRHKPASSTTRRRNISGKNDFTISTSGQNTNALRNCATCTAIR